MKERNMDETDATIADDCKDLLGPDTEKMIVVCCGFVRCTRSHNSVR